MAPLNVRLVNGTLGATGSSVAMAVKTGATLGGSGTINRVVTLEAGATLEPGDMSAGVSVPGTIKTNAFTAAGTMKFQLGEANKPAGTSALTGRAVTKRGTGDLITTVANSFSGALKIEAGRMVLGNGATAGSIDNVSSITVDENAALRFNNDSAVTFNKVISGAGGLEKAGSLFGACG